MMRPGKYFLLLCSAILIFNCRTSEFITDKESANRQKMMRKYRTGIIFTDVAIQIGSTISGVSVSTSPKSFRNLKLRNYSSDTLYVNMVTDCLWRDSTYCDIKDIVLPPTESLKLITPLGAAYNVYFRKDFTTPEDEMIEINTAKNRVIRLGKPLANKKLFIND